MVFLNQLLECNLARIASVIERLLNPLVASILISGLLSLGYTRDESIRGAPFDFRFAMSSDPNNYFAK